VAIQMIPKRRKHLKSPNSVIGMPSATHIPQVHFWKVFWLSAVFAFWSILRAGNITSFSQNKFDKRVNILRSSIEFGSFGLRAKVFKTKNNRKGRDFTIPVTGDWLCGVTPLQ